METPRRRLTVAATVLTLLVAPATAGAQTGAGDQQYSDPLAGTTTSSSGGGSSSGGTGSGSSATGTGSELSQTPPVVATTPTTPTGATGQTPQATGQLANTGTDPRVLALLGMALLLAGVGLRLRLRDARY